MLLSKFLSNTAKNYPDKTAVICEDKRFSYADFESRVKGLAFALKEFGVKPGERIAIIHKNCHYFLESYFATAFIGTIIVPVNYRLSQKEFTYILNNSDAKVLITNSEFSKRVLPSLKQCPQIENIIWTDEEFESNPNNFYYEAHIKNKPSAELDEPYITEESPAQLYYTSGTTGKPKGVVLTHRNNCSHTLGTIEELNLTEMDNWLHVSPMFHLADAWSVWAITKVGGTHTIVSEFNPENVLSIIEQEKVTVSNFIPTLLNILVNYENVESFDFKSLRLIMSGGAPIAPEVIRQVMDIFKCKYTQTYGMTETSPFLTMSILKPHLKKLPSEEQFKYLATTGRTFTGVELKIVDENNNEVQTNDSDVGEIIVKGDTITKEYWKLPGETSKRIKNGWLHTGDLAKINSEGYLTIVDRKDDMIITGGENVYSIEVENVLYSYPDILETAVIGIHDNIWGEKIIAAVVLKPGKKTSSRNILDYCKDNLADFKVPKEIVFTNELPKTGPKKISKQKLREKLSQKDIE